MRINSPPDLNLDCGGLAGMVGPPRLPLLGVVGGGKSVWNLGRVSDELLTTHGFSSESVDGGGAVDASYVDHALTRIALSLVAGVIGGDARGTAHLPHITRGLRVVL